MKTESINIFILYKHRDKTEALTDIHSNDMQDVNSNVIICAGSWDALTVLTASRLQSQCSTIHMAAKADALVSVITARPIQLTSATLAVRFTLVIKNIQKW